MYPTLWAPGAPRLRALMSVLLGSAPSKATRAPFESPEGSSPRWNFEDHDVHDDDLEWASGLNESHEPSGDPDVAICKLSLTRDDAKHPRAHIGPFGHDFIPFM